MKWQWCSLIRAGHEMAEKKRKKMSVLYRVVQSINRKLAARPAKNSGARKAIYRTLINRSRLPR